MITRETLKQVVMFGYLPDDMLDLLIPIAELLKYGQNEHLFKQGDTAERIFFVLQGKVLLEKRISEKITVFLSAIKPGYLVGWSAMLDDGYYTTDAICSEPTSLLSFRASRIKRLLEENHTMGYILSQRLLRVIKKRYDARTEQFVKIITHHPDILKLL